MEDLAEIQTMTVSCEEDGAVSTWLGLHPSLNNNPSNKKKKRLKTTDQIQTNPTFVSDVRSERLLIQNTTFKE